MKLSKNTIINFIIVVLLLFCTNEALAIKPLIQSPSSKYVYPVNKNGQTYGADIYEDKSGYEPDLIAAIGRNGIHGYVYSSDLNGDNPRTPEEAIQQKNNSKIIPLYDKDGTTVIGEFKIEATNKEYH